MTLIVKWVHPDSGEPLAREFKGDDAMLLVARFVHELRQRFPRLEVVVVNPSSRVWLSGRWEDV